MKTNASLRRTVQQVVERTPVLDIHTHLYDPAFESLLLWGIDELLVYHYLVAEGFRQHRVEPAKFWALSRSEQADLIWDELFLRRSPISEACRGVITTLNRLGLDVKRRDLAKLRRWFADQRVDRHVTRVFEAAGVRQVCMTNSPFDDAERSVWERGFAGDPRFLAALRIDPLLMDWPVACRRLSAWGYPVQLESPGSRKGRGDTLGLERGRGGTRPYRERGISPGTADAVRRFLEDWTRRIGARYVMVSLPPEFTFPAQNDCSRLLDQAVLPFCRESGLPLALMLGVRRAVNPALGLAGDGVGRSDLGALANLCAANPSNRFLVTVLSRENQHELCVLARKFGNLHIFGCWWFTNVPHLIDEITRLRLELVGLSCTPQHSDARVMDQLIYKWAHFREVLTGVLADKYCDLAAAGWPVGRAAIERDVQELFGGAFERFCT